MDVVGVSKRLSFVLRHRPDSVGLRLDPQGWVAVDDLLAALAAHGLRLSRDDLDRVVAGNDKRRFAFDETGTRIRASQGHSVGVDLGTRRSRRRPSCSTARAGGSSRRSSPRACAPDGGTRCT